MRAIDTVPARPPERAPFRPAPAVRPRPAGGNDLRYLVNGRVVPAVLYTLLGYFVVRNAIGLGEHLAPVTWLTVTAGPVREGLFAAFCLIPVVLFVIRPRPQIADGRILPRVVAFAGTAILLLTGTSLPQGMTLVAVPAWVGSVCSMVLVVATAGAVWGLLSLRLSFGIFPAARRLVTRGPYRVVRHPLYFCEMLSALAMVVSDGHLVPLLIVALFCVLQVTRIGYEERLLKATFPEWAPWAKGRARLIPGVW